MQEIKKIIYYKFLVGKLYNFLLIDKKLIENVDRKSKKILFNVFNLPEDVLSANLVWCELSSSKEESYLLILKGISELIKDSYLFSFETEKARNKSSKCSLFNIRTPLTNSSYTKIYIIKMESSRHNPGEKIPLYLKVTKNSIEEISKDEIFLHVENAPLFIEVEKSHDFILIEPRWSLFYVAQDQELRKITIDSIKNLRKVLCDFDDDREALNLLDEESKFTQDKEFVLQCTQKVKNILEEYCKCIGNKENLILYTSYYNKSLENFIDYIGFLNNEAIKIQEIDVIKLGYYINEMEVMLLTALRHGIINHAKWIISPAGYSFILSEIFFIKLCKDIIKIEKSNDLLEQLCEKLFPTIKSLLKKIDKESYRTLFPEDGNIGFSITFFQNAHDKGYKTISKLLIKITKVSEWLQMYMSAKNELEELQRVLEPFIATPENFFRFIAEVLGSIEYRIANRTRLEQKITIQEADYLNKVKEISRSFDQDKEDRIKNLLDLLKMEDLTTEEKSFLEKQKLLLEKDESKPMNLGNLEITQQKEKLSTFPNFVNLATDIPIYSTMGGKLFELQKVAKDGNCGYTAFGIERNDAYQRLKKDVFQIQHLLIPVIQEQLLEENFIHYLIKNNFADSGLLALFKTYQKQLEQKLNINDVENQLLAYANNSDVIKGYLAYDVKDKQIDEDWSHPCVLQALAHIRGIRLYLWERIGNNQLTPHQHYHEYLPAGATEDKHLLFVNRNHFELLIETVAPTATTMTATGTSNSTIYTSPLSQNTLNTSNNAYPTTTTTNTTWTTTTSTTTATITSTTSVFRNN